VFNRNGTGYGYVESGQVFPVAWPGWTGDIARTGNISVGAAGASLTDRLSKISCSEVGQFNIFIKTSTHLVVWLDMIIRKSIPHLLNLPWKWTFCQKIPKLYPPGCNSDC
jgi:hypothetical protein